MNSYDTIFRDAKTNKILIKSSGIVVAICTDKTADVDDMDNYSLCFSYADNVPTIDMLYALINNMIEILSKLVTMPFNNTVSMILDNDGVFNGEQDRYLAALTMDYNNAGCRVQNLNMNGKVAGSVFYALVNAVAKSSNVKGLPDSNKLKELCDVQLAELFTEQILEFIEDEAHNTGKTEMVEMDDSHNGDMDYADDGDTVDSPTPADTAKDTPGGGEITDIQVQTIVMLSTGAAAMVCGSDSEYNAVIDFFKTHGYAIDGTVNAKQWDGLCKYIFISSKKLKAADSLYNMRNIDALIRAKAFLSPGNSPESGTGKP